MTDDLTAAVSIAPGTTRGCLGKPQNKHAYLLPVNESPGGAIYQFDYTGTTRICLSFFDQDRNGVSGSLSTSCLDDAGARQSAWFAVAPGTKGYLVVEGLRIPRPTTYELQLAISPLDEAAHHTPESATPIELGQAHHGFAQFLANGEDQHDDWFAIEIPKNGVYEIQVAEPGPKARMTVEVYDLDRKRIHEERMRDEGATLRSSWKVKRGRYVLRLSDWIGAHKHRSRTAGAGTPSFSKPYTLSVDKK